MSVNLTLALNTNAGQHSSETIAMSFLSPFPSIFLLDVMVASMRLSLMVFAFRDCFTR